MVQPVKETARAGIEGELAPPATPLAPAPPLAEVITPQEIPTGTIARDDTLRIPSGGEAKPEKPSIPWTRQPKGAMLRSVVFPGWGQWHNGRKAKALAVAAGEGYLIYRAFHYGHKEAEAKDLLRAHRDDPELEARYQRSADYRGDRRRDFTWWSIFAAVLSMGDAYVDAHLGRDFDGEFEPQEFRGTADGSSGTTGVTNRAPGSARDGTILSALTPSLRPEGRGWSLAVTCPIP